MDSRVRPSKIWIQWGIDVKIINDDDKKFNGELTQYSPGEAKNIVVYDTATNWLTLAYIPNKIILLLYP